MTKNYFLIASVAPAVLAATLLCFSEEPQQALRTNGGVSATTIAPGTPADVTTNAPGQNVNLTFSGTAGEQVSVVLTGSTYASDCKRCLALGVSILKPDGTALSWTGLSNSATDRFLDSVRLPSGGTYTIVVSPQGKSIGSVKVTLYAFRDVTGTLTPDSPATFTTNIPGQNAKLTFSGTAGQQLSLNLSNSSFGACTHCNSVAVRILKPDGTALGWTKLSDNATGASVDSLTLPVSGAYTVVIDPQGERTGSVTVAVVSR